MSDRPSPSNGKRDVFWGTQHACPVCGRCLCYACHPQGPCLDERDAVRVATFAVERSQDAISGQ